jgi:protein TonB
MNISSISTLDKVRKIRLTLFLAVALVHVFLIFFVVFNIDAASPPPEDSSKVMKLVDIQEEIPLIPSPPPPPPPPPPAEPPPVVSQNAVEAAAETMIAADEVPQDQVVVSSLPVVQYPAIPRQPVQKEIEYLKQSQISETPQFSDKDILKNLIYPPIAQRSGIEGTVILELFIDPQGSIRRINILKETPEGRGFGEAAVNAFKGIKAIPAKANGVPVAVRYRYPIRFALK